MNAVNFLFSKFVDHVKKLILLSLLLGAQIGFAASKESVDEFLVRVAKTHQFELAQLKSWMSKAKKQQKIIDSMNTPAEGLPWHKYRKIWMKSARIKAGVEFWNKYQTELKRAEETFQVPAEIIVGIIGVETYYGRIKGSLSVLDALYTLGFHYPKRAKFFKKELEQFFLLCREQKWDPSVPTGSYAGAMGMGQFISTSYREYAVDFNGDGKIDLFNDPVDAIGSVANYFRKHKWRWGEPVAYKVSGDSKKPEQWYAKRLKPTTTAASIEGDGWHWPVDTVSEQKASLYPFKQPSGTDHWIGFENFYVITRYNRSPLYALAVYQFSLEVVAARAKLYYQS